MLDRALRAADWLSLRAVWVGGALLFLAAFTVSVDVLARKLFTVSLGGADELSGYAFAIGTAWAFSFALLRRANVRVDALYQHLPRRLCAMLDILALVSLGVFVTFLSYYAYDVLATSWDLAAQSNSALKVPLWIPQALWVAGLALFLGTITLLLVRSLAALFAGDWTTIHTLLGARSIREEADDEAKYAHETERKGRPG
ncbi:MAG: TRAP transporter small permease [Rhodobacteraceae bacterium]|nr:TRAP transporter small permease [Paracoccaceae bacterium]